MRIDALRAAGLCFLAFFTANVSAHGLVQDPPARNWFCGAVTKPDQVQNGVAQYPVCGGAFFAPGIEPTAGYSFMSVLTHTTGRAGIGPRTNVCGFNSETWNGAATVWDQPIDWPTVPMTAGARNFVWNISWGPHFSDTADFRYWITKSSFVWQTGRALSFSDFEDLPFCDLAYNDATPNANPNLIPDKANALFTTRCTVPARSGRHVIYAEWGRTPPTLERFHGCIDAAFSGSQPPTVTANIALNPNVSTFTGAGTMSLIGTGSTGSNLTYSWSVSAPNTSPYTITNPMSATATLNMVAPAAAQDVTVVLLVTNGTATDTETRQFLHQPVANTQWQDLGALTTVPLTLVVGDRVSVRTVSSTGQDAFWPTTPITITSANTASTQWPVTLGNAVNAMNGNVRIGVLNTSNNTIAVNNNTFVGNQSTGDALAVRTAVATFSLFTVQYTNNIFWDNNPDALDGTYDLRADSALGAAFPHASLFNNDVLAVFSAPLAQSGNVAVDPAFVDAASGDFHLRSTSPLVDAGLDAPATGGVGALDLGGASRLQGQHLDMGAYETDPEFIFRNSFD